MKHALDLLDLKGEEKDLLTRKDQGFSITDEELSLFFQGKEIDNPSSEEGKILSVLNLFDEKDNLFYPLMLHRIENREGKLRKQQADYLNPLALEVLKSNEIDISDSDQWTREPSSLNFLLGARLQFQGKGKGLALHKGIFFHPIKALDHILVHDTLHLLFSPSQRPQKYYGLFSSDKKNENLSALPRAFLRHRYQDIKQTLENRKAIKVVYRTEEEKLPFLTDFLLSAFQKEESVLFLSERRENLFWERTRLDKEAYDLSCWRTPFQAPQGYFRKREEEQEKDALSSLTKRREDYAHVAQKRRQGFRKTKAFLSQIPQKNIEELLQSPVEVMPLSLGEYEEPDFRKDLHFLTILSTLDEIENTSLKDFLYYGLSVSPKEENYRELQETLKEIVSGLSSFIDKLEEENFLDIEGKPISTFAQFEDYGECVHLLAGYTGFPRKYFDIEIDEKELLKLKKIYQDRSSTLLLLRSLFHEDLTTEKKKELAELLSSASFLKREKAKKELSRRIGHIVRKEEEKTIEELLLRSLKSDEEFSKTIESYAQLYGDSVRTMNGLIEILSNRSYIQRFRQFEKRKGLSMEHPLIKKGLRDRRYAQSRMEEFSLYDKEYQRIKSKINHYITFFLDDRRDFLHMDMKKMLLFFQRKEEGSYPLFSQYALFLKESKEISMPLQLVLRRRILSGEKLLHLRRDYLLSLLFSLYQEERKNRKDEEEEWLSKRELYLEEVQKIPETLPLFLKEKLKRMRGRKTRDIFFQDTYQRVEELTKRGESIEQEDITTTLPALYPLLLAKREDLPMLSSEMVDILIVEDSKGLPDSALLLALTSARKVLFLEKAEEEDLRISGYEQSSVDRPSLYLSFYDRRMDKNILDFFRTILEEKEEELVLDEKIFPYLLLKKEKEEKEVLFFDLLIPPELEEETDLDLREFFSFVDHLPARDIDMVEQYLQMRKKA